MKDVYSVLFLEGVWDVDKGECNDDESVDWEVDIEVLVLGNVRGKGFIDEGISNDVKLWEVYYDFGVCWLLIYGYWCFEDGESFVDEVCFFDFGDSVISDEYLGGDWGVVDGRINFEDCEEGDEGLLGVEFLVNFVCEGLKGGVGELVDGGILFDVFKGFEFICNVRYLFLID